MKPRYDALELLEPTEFTWVVVEQSDNMQPAEIICVCKDEDQARYIIESLKYCDSYK